MKLVNYVLIIVTVILGMVAFLIINQNDEAEIIDEFPDSHTSEGQTTDDENRYNSGITVQNIGNGQIVRQEYVLHNEDSVMFAAADISGIDEETVLETIECKEGAIHLFSTDGGWEIFSLKEGVFRGTMFVLDHNAGSYMAYLPMEWMLLKNGSRRLLSEDGYIKIIEGKNGFFVQVCTSKTAEESSIDYTVVKSGKTLVDWDYPQCLELWGHYTNSGKGKWCSDGYYWNAPATYDPTGKDVYYRMVESYISRSFLAIAHAYRLAEDLAIGTLNIMAEQQNEEGFFPTLSLSTWLFRSYSLQAGFYDTRFNSGLIDMFITAYSYYGLKNHYDVLANYAMFYAEYAETHHRKTQNGGYLIDDYYHPGGGTETHASLNHLLAEAFVLYRLSDALGDTKLELLADKIVLAAEDTFDLWIAKNGDLHYAIYPDGEFKGKDYPDLTYKDLLALQDMLEVRNGARSEKLDYLIEAKKKYMEKNGIFIP